MSDTTRPANRLAQETSPYLLQHAHNPVDWYPWGEEALERARREDRLILLSIGYSACHWCHVMERESFENESIAAMMNEHFVNIKVDREERPDLDDIYMAATVALNRGQGGWPMTVFLTPQLEPVFAGTYFPPEDLPGRPGFPRLLTEVQRAWTEDREGMAEKARNLTHLLQRQRAVGPGLNVGEELQRAIDQYAEEFDETFGGFGSAPKFPPAVGLMLLLRLHRRFADERALTMVRTTLEGMARGGMYDHIGGGFARYSTDRLWLVPHFEKMLYDNALLARAYLEAYQATEDPFYRQVAVETLDYVRRDMTADNGGFFSSTDADSEGEEGKFFVWRPEEIEAILGAEDAAVFNAYYDITPEGNWEGRSIPRTPRPVNEVAAEFDLEPDILTDRLEQWKPRVFAARETRVKPGLDDKVLTAWNGLMISALAEGYRILGDRTYLEAAREAAGFVLTSHRQDDGRRLWRTSRHGRAHLNGVLEDYAYLTEGLVDLYEAGGDRKWLEAAAEIAEVMIDEFGDETRGAFFNTGESHEELVMRFRDGTDGATPSANAVAASALARLGLHLERPAFRDIAARAIKAYGSLIQRFPRGFAKSLCVVDFLLDEPVELAFVGGGESLEAMRREAAQVFLPNRIQAVAAQGDDDLPLLRGKRAPDEGASLYVCRHYTCDSPITDPADVRDRLRMSAEPVSRGTMAVRRPGAATAEGTGRFRDRFAVDGYAPCGRTGLVVSRIGFGGYRVDDETPGHREALHRALASGVNVIDTSTNYMDGGSERLIGAVLGELIGSGEIRRDEVVIVSKIGYVQGGTYEIAREREEKGQPYPEMVKLGEGLWHCIHPVFLEEQLERSLDRLELETLDACLLHNPEYFLSYPPDPTVPREDVRTEFYRRLEVAFTFLENQVNRGRIRWYGVSSNTVAAPSRLAHATSLARMLEAARRAGGEGHHFGVLQLPLNLFESNPVLSVDEAVEGTVLDAARAAELAVLANRPLNAFVEREMVRLADFVTVGSAIDVEAELDTVRRLEERFREEIAPGIDVPDGAMDPTDYFRFHGELELLVSQEIGLEQWSQIDHQIRAGVGRVVTALDRNLVGETADAWRRWREEYLQPLQLLLSEFRRRAIAHAAERSEAVRAAIDPVFPAERQEESLSRKALWTVASTPGVTSVLTGMRTSSYVEDAAAILGWPPLDAPEEVYGAVRAAPYLPTA